MSKLSRYSLEKTTMPSLIETFWDGVALIEDRNEAVLFFKEFLTPTEVRMFAKRLAIALMLANNYDYQTISHHLKVTNPTISKVSAWLKYGDGGVRKIVERILQIAQELREKQEKQMLPKFRRETVGTTLAKWALFEIGKQLKERRKRQSAINNMSKRTNKNK